MGVLRRVLIPAAVASVPVHIALILTDGSRPLAEVLNESAADWLQTVIFLGGFIAVGYLGSVLPAVAAIQSKTLGPIAKCSLLIVAGGIGGAVILGLFGLVPLVRGSPTPMVYLTLWGAMSGSISAAIWLPFNTDLLTQGALT
jgi:hypothetical protein